MKQVLVRGGGVIVEEVPAPFAEPRSILVRVQYSCVSVGTEMTGVALSGLPLYRRALKQPHHARKALDMARDQGFVRTYKRISGSLAAGTPTGYSAAGIVIAVGDDVTGFAVGDRVACSGAGVANHAELIAVPVNLVVKVPETLPLEQASTVTLGAIAMQGVRRVEPTLGEVVGVIGLGILGQLTVQLLRANGCRVVGSDLDPARAEQALTGGANWVVEEGESLPAVAERVTDGFGLDAVVITAATSSSQVVSDAFQSCRRKGRVVVVGDVGLELKRHDMYEKELDLRMSTSYGPGRYDAVYEEEGRDYPYGYVRWTEGRNFEEYLRLLSEGRVSLDYLPTERYPVADATAAYEALKRDGLKPTLVVLEYAQDEDAEPVRTVQTTQRARPSRAPRIRVGLAGAGAFAEATHIPNIVKLRADYELRAVMSRTGSTAKALASRNEAAYATTDFDQLLSDDEIDLVLVSTRHDLHAPLALRALEAGKNVFVEKPLALTPAELEAIEAFYRVNPDGPLLMTGFNRRFSPAVRRLEELLRGRSPIVADYRMNAGYIPLDHWVHGPEGGGRNIGEASHVYDVFDALVGAGVDRVTAASIKPSGRFAANDNFTASIAYSDGSLCTLTYTALGAKEHPKERLEVYAGGMVATLDDYRSLSVTGRRSPVWSSRTIDKGHRQELEALADCLLRGGPWPISLEEQVRATQISFDVEELLRE